jgi:hypothetical protein
MDDNMAAAHALAGRGVGVFQFALCANNVTATSTETARKMLEFFTNRTSYLTGVPADCASPSNVPAASAFPAERFLPKYKRVPDLRVVAVGATVMPVMQALQQGNFTEGVQVVGLATWNPLVLHSYYVDEPDLTNQPSMYAVSSTLDSADATCAGEDLNPPNDSVALLSVVTPVPHVLMSTTTNKFWTSSDESGALLQCIPGDADAATMRHFAATLTTLFFRSMAGDVPGSPALYLDCVGVRSLLGLSLDVSC